MIDYDEKRNFMRMTMNCDLSFKPADSDQQHQGRCTSLSHTGISFIADHSLEVGNSLQISVTPENAITPPMTAFIEIVRCSKRQEGDYEIAGSIKSIKGA